MNNKLDYTIDGFIYGCLFSAIVMIVNFIIVNYWIITKGGVKNE